jgi:hypothetical protein
MAYQPMFEAPVAHTTNGHSHAYAQPEFEDEWETDTDYPNPEYENEWEADVVSQYSDPYTDPEYEWEGQGADPYADQDYESEWETPDINAYADPLYDQEWEMLGGDSTMVLEYEGDPEFWKKLKRFARRKLAPIAKRIAPKLVTALGSMIPGAGVVAGPLAGAVTSQLLKEGEMEAIQLEAALLGRSEMDAEVADNDAAYEAALTEVLAAQAAETSSDSEAKAHLGATLPLTVSLMGGKRPMRRIMPALSQANSVLVKSLSGQGPAGKQLLRTVPAIQRQTIATLRAAARQGQPINSAVATKAMAAAAGRVLGNAKRVERTVARNIALRQRTVPPNPRRMMG